MSIQPKKLDFLDFKVMKEPWNEYRLADGTIMRVKIVVSNILKEGDGRFSISHTPIFSVRPNEEHLGVASPPLKVDEKLETFIEADDLKISQLTDHWNEYELPSEKIILSARGILVSASRTSRHDEMGIPLYTTNVQLIVKHKKQAK